MGDFIVFVLPTDPTWQPTRDAAERTAALACELADVRMDAWPNVEVEFFPLITVAHPHENLERITCPRCGGELSVDWFDRLVDRQSPNAGGFTDLGMEVPCCGEIVSLAALDYDWPAGFARFRITLWNPDRELTDQDLATLSTTLGHRLQLVHAHL